MRWTQQTPAVGPTLVYCWLFACDAGLAVNQRWANDSCLLGISMLSNQTLFIESKWDWCSAGVVDGGSALKKHWVNVSFFLRYISKHETVNQCWFIVGQYIANLWLKPVWPCTKSWEISLDCHIWIYRGIIRSKIVEFFR